MVSSDNDLKSLVYIFISLIIVILIWGLIMVYSSSYIYAKELYNSSAYFVIRQLMFLLIGLTFAVIISRTKLSFWYKYGPYINLIFTITLIFTFLPGIGVSVKGARRWINLGFIQFQPGELIKYTVLITAINFFDNFTKNSLRTSLLHGFSILCSLVLILLQPDYGTFIICFIGIMFVAFISAFPRKYFYSLFLIGTITGLVVLFAKPYRVQRFFSFLDPWKNPLTSGFQIIQSYLAFASGKFFGQGLGNSHEKLFYLPEAHNDFIFSVIGEESGFLGVFLIVIIFLALIYVGFKIALTVKSRYSSLLISAIIFIVALQVLFNMGVVLGLLPTKGLNLPFISYGGSSLVTNLMGIGLMLSAVTTFKVKRIVR